MQLVSWVTQRSKRMKVILDQESCNLLCLYYENNLSSLNQILHQLSIVYPNKNLNYTDIKNLIINTSSDFNLEYFLDNILKGNKKKSNYILKQLVTEHTIKFLTILHSLQNTIMLLIVFQRQCLLNDDKKSLILLFNRYKIKKNRHILYSEALQRLTLQQLYQIVALLLQTEIMIYQKYKNIIWHNFELLIWLLCDKKKNTIKIFSKN